MRKNFAGISVVLCCVLIFAIRLTGLGVDTDAAANQAGGWQHLALTRDLGDGADEEVGRRINQLGREGWQLVDVEGIQEDGTTKKTIFYFKREG